MSFNRNPTGKNQHNLRNRASFCHRSLSSSLSLAGAEDETLRAALEKYHREKLANNKIISLRLFAEHGIQMRSVLGVIIHLD